MNATKIAKSGMTRGKASAVVTDYADNHIRLFLLFGGGVALFLAGPSIGVFIGSIIAKFGGW